jgi:hypothetical protein
MRRSVLKSALLATAIAWTFVNPAAAQPVIQIAETQVVATGMTPGGRVAWFAFARERTDWTSRVLHWEGASGLADASGQTVLNLGRPVPVKSIFVAIDMSTGAFAASSPPAYPWAAHVPFPVDGLAFGADQVSVVSLRDSHEELEVLVVRPQVGAWRATVRHDDEALGGTPGVLVNFSAFSPWGASPASLGPLRSGDVIVAIDPNRIEYFAQQLAGRR